MKELLTLKEIAQRTDIPPSTIAYYRDNFAEFIPAAEGTGRTRLYNPEVIEVFKVIAEMFQNNHNTTQVKAALSEQYQRFIDVKQDHNNNTKTAQQPDLNEVLGGILGELRRMNDLKEKELFFVHGADPLKLIDEQEPEESPQPETPAQGEPFLNGGEGFPQEKDLFKDMERIRKEQPPEPPLTAWEKFKKWFVQ